MAVGFGCTEFKAAMGSSGKKTTLQAHGDNKDEPQKKRLDFEMLIEIRVSSAYRWQLKFGTRWYHQGQRRESWRWNSRASVLLWHTASTCKQSLLYCVLIICLSSSIGLSSWGPGPCLRWHIPPAQLERGLACVSSDDACRAKGSPRFKRGGRGKSTAGGGVWPKSVSRWEVRGGQHFEEVGI